MHIPASLVSVTKREILSFNLKCRHKYKLLHPLDNRVDLAELADKEVAPNANKQEDLILEVPALAEPKAYALNSLVNLVSLASLVSLV